MEGGSVGEGQFCEQINREPKSIADIAAHDVIFTAIREKAPEWRFRHNGREQIVALTPRLIVNEIDAVLLAAKAGRGLARVLSYQVADELESGKLLRVLPKIESPILPVQLIVPSARLMAPKSRAFLELAMSKLSSLNVLQAA